MDPSEFWRKGTGAMYGSSFPAPIPSHEAANPQQQQQQQPPQQQQQQQHLAWHAQQACPTSPFDIMLRPNSSGGQSAVSAFEFPNIPSPTVPSGPLPYMPPPPHMMPSLQQQGPGRSLVSPFDIPNGRVQQLLANSTINSGSLGRPPPSPFDLFPSARTARSPFDVMLGVLPPSLCTTSIPPLTCNS